MSELARKLLGRKPAPRVHVPEDGERPSYLLHRDGDRWLIVMLHGGKEIARLTPKEARLEANRLISMAWLASNPGSCPQESFG